MELIDRDKLARRMKQMGVSQRELARAAGWKSHSYMRRLLNGEARTLTTDPRCASRTTCISTSTTSS